MTHSEIEKILRETLEDHKLSRGEKRCLREVFEPVKNDGKLMSFARNRAFELAKQELSASSDKHVLEWLKDFVSLLSGVKSGGPKLRKNKPGGVYFSDTHDCASKIASLVDGTKSTLDICVFTITDDRIGQAIVNAHKRGVKVRIITDDEKAEDLGSDIDEFLRRGIEVRTDADRYHMHHKFAIFDGVQLVTGSYNWTRGASKYNQENFIVTNDSTIIAPFQKEFDRLWKRFK